MRERPEYDTNEPWQTQRFRTLLQGTNRLAKRSRPVHLVFRLLLLLLVVGFFAILIASIVTWL